MTLSSWQIEVADEGLDDLRARLRRTRVTGRSGAQPWEAGTDPDYLQDPVSCWTDGLTGAREAHLNQDGVWL
jgi:hypothetical protein